MVKHQGVCDPGGPNHRYLGQPRLELSHRRRHFGLSALLKRRLGGYAARILVVPGSVLLVAIVRDVIFTGKPLGLVVVFTEGGGVQRC